MYSYNKSGVLENFLDKLISVFHNFTDPSSKLFIDTLLENNFMDSELFEKFIFSFLPETNFGCIFRNRKFNRIHLVGKISLAFDSSEKSGIYYEKYGDFLKSFLESNFKRSGLMMFLSRVKPMEM